MKKIKLILKIIALAFVCMACGDNCGKTTYRPEVGVGFVFMYDADGNALHPVAYAKVTVESKWWSGGGLFGKTWIVAEESFITDAEGRYQVRFVERGCYTKHDGDKEMVYCNLYEFYCNLANGVPIRLSDVSIKNKSKDNILLLDTIKIK
ncbi:MAG: carboxypeptidase-like regulatory domain-containing protein [Firmicutes bacterium]|nr:carboxypeptidase-like regulatory domain-containing protein [Bacillota bacterium]